MRPEPISNQHPLRELFLKLVQEAMRTSLGDADEPAEEYIASVVMRFAHLDAAKLKARDREISDLVEMIEAGDIRLSAQSFDDERRAHKHIGDYLLFWEGVYPEHLRLLRREGRAAGLIDPLRQGSHSYYVVSTFRFGDYADEADLFERLSEGFADYLRALRSLRARLHSSGPGALPH
ncbi:MAG: hypothetical protein KatS3mg015_0358 [Fimbriimonadales bacterium]|nr:MAG: hypothetical protein KatS3mg015_0358 [Fimbriimonadales bacterium]